MASFTGVGDTTDITVADRSDSFTVALSGTYAMSIDLQKELGSPSSGSWVTIKTYSTANATVSDIYTTTSYNEHWRLIVQVDTSGTCVATLTDSLDKSLLLLKDPVGNTLVDFKQSGAEFPLGVSRTPRSLTAATYTFTTNDAGRLYFLNASGGIDIIFPAATGSGDVYEFIVGTATTDLYTIEVATGGGDFNGVIQGKADTVTTSERRVAGATDNTLSLGGTSQATGGSVGDYIRIVDIATNEWFITGTITQGGTEATPFSAV